MRFPSFTRLRTHSGMAQQEADGPAGLGAFLPEDATADETGHSAPPLPADRRVRGLVLFLATLVVVEAAPAGLWLHSVLVSRPAAVSPTTLQPPLSLAAPISSVPCEAPAVVAPTNKSTARSASARQAVAASSAATIPGVIAGLVAIDAPVPMHVYAKGQLVGTTEADSVMLPVGQHDLEFVSEAAAYRAKRTVSVQAGKTTKVALEKPVGTVHVNATPWAAVTVDNRPVGETPIGNLKLPIGSREFVFRHPEFGERRVTVLVTLKETARVGVDMRTK